MHSRTYIHPHIILAYTHTNTHTYIHTYTHVYAHTRTHTHALAHTYTHTSTHTRRIFFCFYLISFLFYVLFSSAKAETSPKIINQDPFIFALSCLFFTDHMYLFTKAVK